MRFAGYRRARPPDKVQPRENPEHPKRFRQGLAPSLWSRRPRLPVAPDPELDEDDAFSSVYLMIVPDSQFQDWMRQQRLVTWESMAPWLPSVGARVPTTTLVERRQMQAGQGAPGEVFVKLYHYQQPSWKFVGRQSKARREFHNYHLFAKLGIPHPQPVAYGERRDAIGRLKAAFIITQAVPCAITLAEHFASPRLQRVEASARRQRRHLLGHLARQLRHLHARGFFHYDLVWRNLLVRKSDPDKPAIFWIDCPRGSFIRLRPLRERRRLRDLGAFDKSAARQCSRGERLHFFKVYLRAGARLDGAEKRAIRKVLAYRRRRWPED